MWGNYSNQIKSNQNNLLSLISNYLIQQLINKYNKNPIIGYITN